MEPLTGRAPRDQNRVPVTYGISSADGVTVEPIEVDPSTGRLLVDATGGGSGGTQYTDGAVAPAHPIGTIPVFNNSGTMTAVSAANPLPVNASVSISGVSTATNQTSGSQKTQIVDGLGNVIGATSNALDINIKSGNPTTIAATQSGTWNITNVSGTVSLPTGAATAAKQPALGTAGTASADVITIQGKSGMTAVVVDGSAVTQPISAAALPLPSGASTSAKQPALGTAGTPSSDVITVQGATSMTPLKVDGSGVTQPVSGTVTANVGTTNGLALDATLTGGSQQVQGNIAQGSTDSGNPLKIGALFNTTQPTVTDGQRVSIQGDARGNMRVAPMFAGGTTSFSGMVDNVDGVVTSATANKLGSLARLTVFNGTSWDRMSGDTTGVNVKAVVGALPAGSNTIGALTANQSVNLNQLAGNTISSGVGASGTGTLRMVEANDVGRTLKSAGGSASSSGNNTLVAAGTNKLKVFAFSLTTTSTTAVTCIFQSGASGTELWRVVLQAPTSVNVGANLAVAAPAYLFNTASATLLNLNLSGAQTVHWSVAYFDEA